MEQLVSKLMVFNEKGDAIIEEEVLLEVTDIPKNGEVEIAFNWPHKGIERVYLRIDLGALANKAILYALPAEQS